MPVVSPLMCQMVWNCIPILPMEVNHNMSEYQFLMSVCSKMNELIASNNNLNNGVQLTQQQLAQLQTEIEQMQQELEKVKNGDYVSLYLDSIIKYIDNNLVEMVSRIVKYIFFGLSMDGRLVAYIPDSWDFIRFDTVMNTNSPLFGHLVLQW